MTAILLLKSMAVCTACVQKVVDDQPNLSDLVSDIREVEKASHLHLYMARQARQFYCPTSRPNQQASIIAQYCRGDVCVGYGVGVCVAFGRVHTYVGVFTNVIYSVRFGLSSTGEQSFRSLWLERFFWKLPEWRSSENSALLLSCVQVSGGFFWLVSYVWHHHSCATFVDSIISPKATANTWEC